MNFTYALVHPVIGSGATKWAAYCRYGKKAVEVEFNSPEEANAFCRGWEHEAELRRGN